MRALLLIVMGSLTTTQACRANETGPQRDGPIVRTELGLLQGEQADGVQKFFGIPYAAPPVGSLRWRAPQPVVPWQGVRNAKDFGSACMQPAKIGGISLPPEFSAMSEDCLYMNIWAPDVPKQALLPVLVWIHGSGFIFGAGRGFGIDGTSFAEHGVIVVTMNYRLGLFGQFAHPALEDEGTGGNYALLDLLAALHWVKHNIAAFGGDPEQVTLAGLSAGGSYAQMLMTMPRAKGLFHQVISQSGPVFFGWPTLEEARIKGALVLADELPKGSAEALRALPATTITAATIVDDVNGPRPIIDGKVLANHPSRLFVQERLNARRMIVGSTNFEGALRAMSPVPIGRSDEQLLASLGLPPARIAQLYDPMGKKGTKLIAVDIDGDRNFVAGSRFVARAVSDLGATVYQYQWAYVPEPLRSMRDVAPHGSDQHFVFNQIASTMWGAKATANDRAMAELMHGYWIAFIKGGDPNGDGRFTWPRYDRSSDRLLELASAEPVIRQHHWKDRLDAVETTLLREIDTTEPHHAAP